jgi:HAD superfamily hydrolase (TIGR01549 family)
VANAISTILFDAGGTLVMPNFRLIAEEFAKDGSAVELEALRRAELAIRRDYDRHDYARKPGDGWLNYCSDLARAAGMDRLPSAAFERLRQYQDTLCVWEDVMEGAVAALERLGRRFRLGVVSNASGSVRAAFERIGLARFFETIVDSGVEGVEKPDPRIFRIALERMGERAERAAYVGDIYHVDVVGARSAGLRAVLLDLHGVHAEKPCERVQSLDELEPLFLADSR